MLALQKLISVLLLFFLNGIVIATPLKISDLASGEVDTFKITPNGQRVLYSVYGDSTSLFTLHSVSPDGDNIASVRGPQELFDPMTFQISEDSAFVVVEASDGMWIAPSDGGAAEKFHSSNDAFSAVISPNSEWVIFQALVTNKFDDPTSSNLYSYNVNTKQVTLINRPTNAIVGLMAFTDTHLFFRSHNARLLSVELGRNSASLVNSTSALGVKNMTISRDQQWLVLQSGCHVYSLSLSAASNLTRLSSGMPTQGTETGCIENYQLSEDGRYVVYKGEQREVFYTELFSVPIDGTHSPTKLSVPLSVSLGGITGSSGDAVFDYKLSPNTNQVVYQVVDDQISQLAPFPTLYSVPIEGGNSQQLNVGFSSTDYLPQQEPVVFRYNITNDGGYVIHSAAANSTHAGGDLFISSMDGQSIIRLTARFTNSEYPVGQSQPTPDGTSVIYIGNRAKASDSSADRQKFNELFIVPSDGGTPRSINSPIPSKSRISAFGNTNTGAFEVTADGKYVIFMRNQESNPQIGLFSIDLSTALEKSEQCFPIKSKKSRISIMCI